MTKAARPSRGAALLLLLGCATAPATPETPKAPRVEPTSAAPDKPAAAPGSLDKDLIRRVIASHRAEVRACYEDALVHTPGLAGKIAIRFVIEAGGVVGSAATASSTMASPAVETCLVERIQTWAFPPPKGGGKVIVTYPFEFRRPAK